MRERKVAGLEKSYLPSIVVLPSVSASDADRPFWWGAGGDGRVGTKPSWSSGVSGWSRLGDTGDGGTIPLTLSAQLLPGLKKYYYFLLK